MCLLAHGTAFGFFLYEDTIMETLRNFPGLGSVISLADFDGTELPQMRKFLGGVRHFRMEDIDRGVLPATMYWERWITAVLLMNANATAALPKRIYLLNTDAAATPFGAFQEVDGLAATPESTRLAAFCDPFLPSTGIPQNSAGWFIVAGPTIAYTAADWNNMTAFAIGDPLTVADEATGRVSKVVTENQVLAYAMEAATAAADADENLDKWVLARVPWFTQ